MYNYFEMLREDFLEEGITLNTTTANEHVPQIEIQIKVVKEQVCSTWNLFPYKNFPNRMISRMVENAFFINALPINSGMSSTIYLQTLMTGTTINLENTAK